MLAVDLGRSAHFSARYHGNFETGEPGSKPFAAGNVEYETQSDASRRSSVPGPKNPVAQGARTEPEDANSS